MNFVYLIGVIDFGMEIHKCSLGHNVAISKIVLLLSKFLMVSSILKRTFNFNFFLVNLQSKIVLIRLNYVQLKKWICAFSGSLNKIKQYLIESFITDWNISLFWYFLLLFSMFKIIFDWNPFCDLTHEWRKEKIIQINKSSNK